MRPSLESCRHLALGCLVASAAVARAGPTPEPASADALRHSVVSHAARQAARPGPNPLGGLVVTLRQTSSSPPTVRASVVNDNPYPVTILSYQSPLDPLALQLGMLSVTPQGRKEPLELRVVRVKRVWPPPEEALLVLPPGASATNDMVLQEPTVPMDELDGAATVALEGTWIAVWPRPRSRLSKPDIENASGTAFSGPFSAPALNFRIS